MRKTALLFVWLGAACTDVSSPGTGTLPVVVSFLEAGKLATVSVTEFVPLGDTAGTIIRGATGRIMAGSSEYPLVQTGEQYTTLHPVAFRAGDTLRLQLWVNGTEISGHTVAPAAPQAVALSDSILRVDGAAANPFAGALRATWAREAGALYWTRIRPVPGHTTDIPGRTGRSGGSTDRPSSDTTLLIPHLAVAHYGRHVLTVYAVRREMLDLFGNGSAPGSYGPRGNLTNAIGIFTALAGDSVFFRAAPANQ